jgi:PAS domain S-box-containing protein
MKQFQRDEDAYRALFGPEDLAVFVIAQGIEDCNDEACRLLGAVRERLLGRSPLAFSAPAQPDGTPSAEGGRRRAEAALAGQPQWFQWEFRRADGEPVITLVHMEAVRLDAAVRLLVNVRDLSALWRAEASLRETETRLEQILDHASAVVFVKDPAGRYLFVNREFERLAGTPRGHIVGSFDRDLYPAETAEQMRRNDRRVLEERRPIEVEESVGRSGGARTYLASKFPLFRPDGEPYAVCGIATDITDRKRSEEALQRAALAVSSAGGANVFEGLARSLAEILGVQAVLIAVFVDTGRTRMRTLATYLEGRILKPFEYELARTPCKGVIGREFRFAPSGVHSEFAPGTMFSALGFDSYTAYTLNDAGGTQLGLIAAMDRRPLEGRELTEAMLKIFAVRAAAEVERARIEEGRKRADEAVRASEEQYRAIFNASVDALVLWNSEVRRVDVNPAYERLFGFTRAEVLAGAYPAHQPPEYAERRHALIRRTLAGEPCHAELEAVRKNGERFQVEVRTIPIRHRGEPHVLTITRDITARKRADEALRASEEQYRAIFNGSADGLVLWDSALQRVDINPAYTRIYGYTRDEVLGEAYPESLPPQDKERRRALVRRTLAGEHCHVELESVRKDGERIHVEVRTMPIQHGGEPHVLAICRDVTERKRAEAALRASEEQYRAIFNATADGLTLRDADFRVVDVNPALLAMTGFTREEALGSDRMLFTPPEDREAARVLFARELGGEVTHYETEAMRKDGTRFPVEVRGVPLQYRGEPHVFVIARDITARKRAEEALRSSSEQYRAIFNATADALVLRDADFRIVDVNPAYEAMSGYSRAEVIGALQVVANPPDIDHYVKTLHGKGLAGEAFQFESEGVRKDGSRFDVEVRGVPIQHQGQRHVLYIGRDITARKLADRALRTSEEQYRAVFNATTDGLVLRDADFRVVDVNPALLAMTGHTREEILGLDRWVFVPGGMQEEAKVLHRRVIAGEPIHFECEGVRKDGSRFDVEVRCVPIQYRGQPHALAMARDITVARRAEAERTQLEAQLRQAQKMEAIGHLTGGIAHDFNNILTSVMGYLVLAAEREATQEDAKLAKYVNQAHLSCERARDLIQQMLTFSRGQRGERRAMRLGALVKESVKLLRSTMPATLELVTELDDAAPQVMLDPVQADQVLLNLGINARDATEGHGAVTVGVRRTAVDGAVCASCRKRIAGDFVELAVRDTGPGIAPEAMDRMFEPFFSTKEVGKGSGMGLATVHGIVHEHGGHIVVESQPGRGASFRVLFPTLPAEEAAARPARKARTAAGGAPRVALAGHVLVVDDEAMVSEFMKELLESWGLAVTAKSNGVEAKEAFARAPELYDLVVTDQTMPRVTGLQLARELLEIRPTVPVILYTGYADNLTEAQAHAAGVRALIRKPVEPAALLALLQAHLPSGAHAIR